MPSEIEIAQSATLRPISEIAAQVGIEEQELDLYGRYKAKINLPPPMTQRGKLILVTAMSPTKYGEGKTTLTVGLGQALKRLGVNSMICLREPSLGPVFGIKGGAAGGGYAQVLPMEDINLHFTGDFHAIGAANNLLAAMVDNHLHQGNSLGIDTRTITWRRAMDMNDRSLRSVIVGLGGKTNGVPREAGFDITVASEVMAILCLARDLEDLKTRLGKIVVASTFDNRPVTAAELQADGAMAALLKDAIKPNLVQTLEGSAAFIHGGPFANIAHGCNSLIATRLALSLTDVVVTEAGFGADLGAEKFLDIKCRFGGLTPQAAVLVTTLRAIKFHGNGKLQDGLANVGGHIENLKKYGLDVVVAVNTGLNEPGADGDAEFAQVAAYCEQQGTVAARNEVWAKGGAGGEAIAREVMKLMDKPSAYHPLYELDLSPEEIINRIATDIYGAGAVQLTDRARKDLEKFSSWGYDHLPVCIAKTQYSFSDNPKLLGRPRGFTLTVKEVRLSAGAGFLVAITGDIMTMPGLPKVPSACAIDVDGEGRISGLF